jgi:hypothetical protein
MAVGMKIENTGTVQYANSPISAGKTHGLLTIFTDTSNATPSSGNKMFPRDFTGIASYGYYVNAGTYAGDYYINRNDMVGETFWNYAFSTGEFNLGYFPDYIHWPTDNRFVTVWDNKNNPQDDMNFAIKCGSQTVLNDTVGAGTTYDPSGGTPYYMASGVGSSGAFASSAVNTDWSTQIILTNITQLQPTNVMYRVYDYNTGNDYITGVMLLDPSTSWSDTVSWTQRYPSIMAISLTSM